MRRTVMIVEDEEEVRSELIVLLVANGYEAEALEEFDKVSEKIRDKKPDLVLLDLGLPHTSGYEICREIRRDSKVPIIFITARNTAMDEVQCLMSGGDDFITKPYNIPVLLTRIERLMKRTYDTEQSEQSSIQYKGVELQVVSGKLCYQGKCVELTKNEMKIIYELFIHQGKIVSRTELIEYLWENELYIDDNTLSVHITHIRSKLSKLGVENFIVTRRGMGYQI